jgi:cobalt-zinc-cadmium efflux system outer membrane protein
MNWLISTTSVVMSLGLLIGCASKPVDSGFPAVQSNVSQRLGRQVQWNRMGGDDRAVADAVKSMLAKPLTADEAVQIALLNNRELQATYEDLGVAQADLVQAGLLKNPVFNAAVEFTNGQGTKLQFSVVENFLDLLQIPLRKQIAQTAFEGAKLRVTGAVLDFAGQVRAAFYDQQAAEQLLELRRSVSEATGASFDLARRLHDAGNTTDLDFSTAQAQREQAKLDLANAETTVLNGHERLNVLMGLWGPSTQWAIVQHLPDLPTGEMPTNGIERSAVEHSLGLALARGQVEVAARTLGIKRSFGLLPEAEIGVSSEKEVHGPWEVGPAFSLPIPLFDQGQAAVAGARSDLERARQRYYALAVEVRASARMTRVNLLATRQRADYIHQMILPLRHRIVEQTQLQYNGMLVGPFQLLIAKQNEIEAGVQFVEAQRDYWLARTQVEQVFNGRMADLSFRNTPGRMSGQSTSEINP